MPSRFLRDTFPALLWAAIILSASSNRFSAAQTGGLLGLILERLFPGRISESAFEVIHFTLRKAGHLVAYAIASLLNARALAAGQRGWSLRRSFFAVALAAMLAGIDEFHQSFIPSRTGTPADVIIDAAGATLAQIVAREVAIRERPRGVTLR